MAERGWGRRQENRASVVGGIGERIWRSVVGGVGRRIRRGVVGVALEPW